MTESKPTKTRTIEDIQLSTAMRLEALSERDLNEKSRMGKMSTKLSSIPISLNELMDNLGPINLTRSDVFQGMETNPYLGKSFLTEEGSIDMADQKILNEIQSYNSTPTPKPTEQVKYWDTKKFIADTRNGNQIPIWKIVNKQTGVSIDKVFRLEEVAYKITTILNETGNMNDTRVISIMHSYDKRDNLLKEIRSMEKDAQGKPMKTQLLESKKMELAQIDYKLGIAG